MKKILIFGGSGLVGSQFIGLYNQVFEIQAPLAEEVDILNKDQVAKITQDFKPDAVINFAAFTNVEAAEEQKGDKNGICYKINAIGAKNVAESVQNFSKHLIHISTDYVFDGTKADSPYIEEDQPHPINWYGETKYAAEQFILNSRVNGAIVRISMPFSPFYELKKDIARFFLDELKQGKSIKAISDQRVTPTIVSDIANALKLIIEADSSGIYHVSSTDSVSPLEFAKTIAEVFHLNYPLVNAISFDEYNKGKKAKLLRYSWLNPTKFEREFGEGILHTVDESLVLFKKAVDAKAGNRI